MPSKKTPADIQAEIAKVTADNADVYRTYLDAGRRVHGLNQDLVRSVLSKFKKDGYLPPSDVFEGRLVFRCAMRDLNKALDLEAALDNFRSKFTGQITCAVFDPESLTLYIYGKLES